VLFARNKNLFFISLPANNYKFLFMSFFINIYNIVFYKPLFNALIFLINVVPFHDIGVAVIILTIIVRIILFPFTHKSVKTQIKIKQIEPEIKKIKEEHKNNRQKQTEETMKLYREHGISPYSGCLMLIIQLPLLFALYKVFWNGLSFDGNFLYPFLNIPPVLQIKFLGLIDITKASYILAFLAGISQYFQIKLATIKKEFQEKNKKNQNQLGFQDYFSRSFGEQMKYIMPVFIFFIASRLPGAVALYWTTMNIFAIVHESIVRNKAKKINNKNQT
jgi:YidC/Oxa1 family membrane protein insertase